MTRYLMSVMLVGCLVSGCLPEGQVTEANIDALAKGCEPVAVQCNPGDGIIEDYSGWTDWCLLSGPRPGDTVGAFFIPYPTSCPPSNPRLYTAPGADDCRCY